jgi:hypothetical protein
MLPKKISFARIFTYDWDSNTHSNAALDNLLGHPKTLLEAIKHQRPKVRMYLHARQLVLINIRIA